MKLSCLQENLSRGLAIVGRAVATRTTLPITNNVFLATENGRLKLAATNLEIAIVHWVGAKVEKEGAITVPARLLTDFVNSLPNDKVEMELSGKSKSLQLKCAKFEARFSGMDAEDFPPIPAIDQGITIKIEAEHLRTAIGRVVFAAATEDSRPVLTGVNVEVEGDMLTLAAADGFRLSVDKTKITTPVKEKLSVIIPSRALNEVGKLIAEAKDPVTITVNTAKSQVLFSMENARLVSQLIQGNFPNYSQLIPQKHSTRVTVDLEEFLRATKAASIFARDASGIVRLLMSPKDGSDGEGKVTVSARAEEVGDNVGEVEANIEGPEAKIAFNAKYMTDVLNVIGKGELMLDVTNASSPGLFHLTSAANFKHVVMPMFVQW